MIIHKIAVYKRRTIIYNLLSNPVGIGLRGFLCFGYRKRAKKDDVNVLCSEFAQRYVYIAKII